MGLDRLWFKLESCNPSGSYKDRFIAAEVSRMLRLGTRSCVATSSGNTGSALAAYCARYGLACSVVVNQYAPAGKLVQMQAHGARVIRVSDFTTSPDVTREVLATLTRLSETSGMAMVVSAYRYCPEGMAGVEAISRELCTQLGAAPSQVFVPVGGGGLLTAICRGLKGAASRIHAVQPSGCLTVVASWQRGDGEIRPVTSTTRISGLAVPFDIDATSALDALRAADGLAFSVEDDEVFEMQRRLLREEGIYCEPAGAAALAGLRRAVREGTISRGESVVCLITGHGFKDPDSVADAASRHPGVFLQPEQLAGYLKECIAQS